jgi:Tol biopolymer transport system component
MSIHQTTLITAIVVSLVCASSDAAEQTCANQIVFDSSRSGNTEVYILDIVSGAISQLTGNEIPGTDSRFPDFAPGGGQVVFVSENEEGQGKLIVVDSKGNGRQQLTDDEAVYENPAWSPDGEWIAFEKAKHGEWGLYLIRPDGSSLRRIGPTDVNLFHPSWSPDASQIAVVTGDEEAWMVGVLDLHDGKVRPFTESGAGVGSVKWSTDGSKLVFDSGIQNNRDLYVLDFRTLAIDRLTEGPAVDARPEWSPDMTQLVFHSTRDRGGSVSGDERWEEFELYILDLESRDVKRITDNDWFDAHPDWCVP